MPVSGDRPAGACLGRRIHSAAVPKADILLADA
jgi:hypothetical protein